MKQLHTKNFANLIFGDCRLSLAVDRDCHYENVKDLANRRIATSLPAFAQTLYE
ncbi:ATP phosphoribosyltransferase [Haemophilus influenzae]|uniref:ATP phosphoribosyltransferase n=1 Tax=Haemophilus influenzae TaxID=727 RepID=A0A2X1PL08_HAEIF|nr:ATP phosphoribosyltransferase [Haemophilus influenzae]